MTRVHWRIDNTLQRLRCCVVAGVLALAGVAGCAVGGARL